MVRTLLSSSHVPSRAADASSVATQSQVPTPPLEEWRLWFPGMPSSYTDDCAVVVGEAIAKHAKDMYDSAYNFMRHGYNEVAYDKWGEIPQSSLFGAPVSRPPPI